MLPYIAYMDPMGYRMGLFDNALCPLQWQFKWTGKWWLTTGFVVPCGFGKDNWRHLLSPFVSWSFTFCMGCLTPAQDLPRKLTNWDNWGTTLQNSDMRQSLLQQGQCALHRNRSARTIETPPAINGK
jgi:hypothetical protein